MMVIFGGGGVLYAYERDRIHNGMTNTLLPMIANVRIYLRLI